jgi:hypothetical protein
MKNHENTNQHDVVAVSGHAIGDSTAPYTVPDVASTLPRVKALAEYENIRARVSPPKLPMDITNPKPYFDVLFPSSIK